MPIGVRNILDICALLYLMIRYIFVENDSSVYDEDIMGPAMFQELVTIEATNNSLKKRRKVFFQHTPNSRR